MTDVSDNLLNETALQYSTTSIGDMKNVEVEENEINIGIAEHEVTQEKEVGWRMEQLVLMMPLQMLKE